MQKYKFSAWMLENGKEILWLTYHYKALNPTIALSIASEYLAFRECTNEIVKTEVKLIN